MNNTPHVINIRFGFKIGNRKLMDSMLCDGLIDAFVNIHMGITGEHLTKILTNVYYIILNIK